MSTPGRGPSGGASMPVAGGSSGGPVAEIPLRTVVQSNGDVVLQARLVRPIYLLTCKQPTTIQKQHVDGSWRALQDDRPMPGAFYLDGAYQTLPPAVACDVPACIPFPGMQPVGSVIEYVQIGVAMPRNGPARPAIESRAVRSGLRVAVNYYEDPMCQQLVSTFVALSVPEGVCCDFGAEGCDSHGPVGGWAVSYEECPSSVPGTESGYLYRRPDAFGCLKLAPGEGPCCGCEDDAGVAP